MTARQLVLALALAATLAAVWLAERSGSEDAADSASLVEVAPRHRVATGSDHNAKVAGKGLTQSRPAPSAVTPVATKSTPRFAIGGADLFPAQSWKPPPPPAPVVVAPPPPPPQAPPLPFKYLGRWDGGDGELVFLEQNQKAVTMRAGQMLAQWRLDKIGADAMNFTYVPLQQQRQLRYGP